MTPKGERFARLDIGIAAVATVIGVVGMALETTDDKINASVLAVPLFALMTIPLLWRRIAPLQAAGAVLAGLLVHVALFTDHAVRCGILLPAAFLLAFACAAHLDMRQALAGLGLVLAIGLLVCASDNSTGADLAAFGFVAPITLAVWAVGRVARQRSAMTVELQARTVELKHARDDRARLEVAGDRARLSAELDELLQQRLAQLAALADGGAGAGDAHARLVAIEHASRSTLEEMRGIVGVLRHGDGEAPLEPQPALASLEALLVSGRGPGAHLRLEGNPRALPAGVELSAYRIVEHLLDTLQDGDVDVCVRFDDDALELKVAGPARRRGGDALDRARERAQLHSGTLQAHTEDGRAETIVSLPIYAAA